MAGPGRKGHALLYTGLIRDKSETIEQRSVISSEMDCNEAIS
jgi:hypothetical protein